jgi:hypothetical protein
MDFLLIGREKHLNRSFFIAVRSGAGFASVSPVFVTPQGGDGQSFPCSTGTSRSFSMRAFLLRFVAVAALSVAGLSPASAQTVLSQWNFNSPTVPNATVIGSGTLGGYGQGAPPSLVSSILYNGTLIDSGTVVSGTSYNRSLTVNPPLTSQANNTTGIWFSAPTTGMNPGEAVKISFSQTVGYRSSRYWQILVSTTGGTSGFSIPSGGTGSSISQSVSGYNTGTAAISGTATVNVNSTGLIDFRTIGSGTTGNLLTPSVTTTGTVFTAPLAAGFVDNISFTLPTGLGYENNANFRFAIVGAFDPAYLGSSGTNGYVSSFTGQDSLNTIDGYNRSSGSGGSLRLDLVTVTAVPEPATIAMVGTAALIGGTAAWRRRRRRRLAA